MLQDNIRNFRKTRGLTQEELAIRLNVVRQTVSKWEKGLSVPDADMLQKLADILEVSVSQLLGGEPEQQPQQRDEIAQQLARINEQLAVRNRRAKRFWRLLGIIFSCALAFWLLTIAALMVFSFSGPVVTSEVIVHDTEYQGIEAPTE